MTSSSFAWRGARVPSFLMSAAVVAATVTVAGCGSSSTDTAHVACPTADISGQLGSVSRFTGTAGNFANLAYRARLTSIKGDCDIDDTGVTVNLKVTLMAEAGPAATESSAHFPYFVAVVDGRDRVIAKQMVDDPVTFTGSQHRGGAADSLTQRIPLADPREAEAYHVLIGFQLTQEELAYNRSLGATR